ncbi:MAG TPA: nuclear transport factor 2 family protein [Ktedonobacterales bacterium]|nr:nuclear transport factor 2 family protein [Ktedonobacterales bacterium]
MEQGISSAARILVIEPDDDLREALQTTLQEEGYQVSGVASLEQALSAVDEQSFHLVLADVFVGRSPHSFSEAHILRRHVHPTPLAVLTTQKIDQEEAAYHKFAFIAHMPFDLDGLLALVAAQFDHPLSAEQQRQAEVVRRFYAALDANDWDTLKTLCAVDITFFPPAKMPFDPSKRVRGLDTYLAYVQEAKRFYPDHVTEDMVIYARPRGLAARYQASWRLPNFTTQRLAGTTLFHFEGEHIRQIGVSMSLERLLQGIKDAPEDNQAC